MIKRLIFASLLIALLLPAGSAAAQDSTTGPIYIVEPGDTLNVIAFRFGVSVDDLMIANGMTDQDMLNAGAQLVIPGLEGVTGTLTTQIVPLGENLSSLSRRYRFPREKLIQLNRITSPSEIYAGASVIIPQGEANEAYRGMASLSQGESLIEAAAREGINPWLLAESNSAKSTWQILPGDTLYYADPNAAEEVAPISPLVTSFSISPLPVEQGGTVEVRLTTSQPLELQGELDGNTLAFLSQGNNEYLALQGLHAMTEPGLADFSISGSGENGASFHFEQRVLLKPGYFGEDPPLQVDPTTIDTAITGPEEKVVRDTITPVTPEKYWDGIFRQPVDEPACIKSWYGNRRSYNGSDYNYFHTGVDYGVCANLNIYAPAAGVVVFAGPLTVRGNATIINHGWGVYSGIWHQTSQAVKVGDRVEAGQFIGEIGGTGRVTGPHLHWEVWVHGNQVEPIDWLEQEYPATSGE